MDKPSLPAVPLEAALLVVCPEADPVVGRHRSFLDSAAQVGVPAHITVAYPFKPVIDAYDIANLEALFLRIPAFTTTFAETDWFGSDVLFLRPLDSEPLSVVYQAVSDAFPDWPIFGGVYDSYVPHLTVGHNQPVALLREAEADVTGHLPVIQPITAVDLWSGPALASGTGQWRKVRSFPLGGALAQHAQHISVR
ncbi:MAG: 2'-5' RNA ligase family protein [Propionibacteriaceae bacterium]|nr:2'-5' RNA ligase family protein [Propionibacteriaceae bacterium]